MVILKQLDATRNFMHKQAQFSMFKVLDLFYIFIHPP